jgi:hypothetical protein
VVDLYYSNPEKFFCHRLLGLKGFYFTQILQIKQIFSSSCLGLVCHFEEREIFARNSTKISSLLWSYLRRFLLCRNDKLSQFYIHSAALFSFFVISMKGEITLGIPQTMSILFVELRVSSFVPQDDKNLLNL